MSMSVEHAIRIQICPASAMAAVASGENATAKGFIPPTLRACGDSREEYLRNVQAIWGADPDCPAEVLAKVEQWLIETRGTELRKAKNLEKALRAVSMVSCLWRTDPEQAEAEKEKEQKKNERRALKQKTAREAREEVENTEALIMHLWARCEKRGSEEVERVLRVAYRERAEILRDAYRERDSIIRSAIEEAVRDSRRINRAMSRAAGYRSRSPDERKRAVHLPPPHHDGGYPHRG